MFFKKDFPPQPCLPKETKEFQGGETLQNRCSGFLKLAKMHLPMWNCAIKNTHTLSFCRAVVVIAQRTAFLTHFY